METYQDLSDEEILENLPVRKTSREPVSKARNERELWLEKTSIMLGYPIKRVAKMTEGWSAEWLRDNYLQANKPEVKRPAAMWMYIWKHPKK